MKNIFSVLIFVFITVNSYSQQYIQLKDEQIELKDRKFYVNSVNDKRINKDGVGEIWRGTFKKPEKIDIEGGLQAAAERYFLSNFPQTSEDQIKTEVQIKHLYIKQEITRTGELGYAHLIIDFIDPEGYRVETKAEINDEGDDAFSTHEERIRKGFYECIVQYNTALENYEARNANTGADEDETVEIVFDKEKTVNREDYTISTRSKPANRNITTVGYQIGGLTLIGIDHEIRVHDYFGVHFGGGLFGYSGGIKIHTNEKTNSLFLNLSWKDGGLGLINGVGAEAGGRWIWVERSGFGLLYQGGLLFVNHIDESFKNEIYGTGEFPSVLFSFGIGFSW